MARSAKTRGTPGLRFLEGKGVPFTVHTYEYVERGGTRASSEALGVDQHAVVKTLIFEDDSKKPFIVLMHGDRKVSAKNLARVLGVKRVAPCTPEVAQKHSGYQVGGTSPFGTRKSLPVYMESSISSLPEIYINGGARGLLVSMDAEALMKLLEPTLVEVATS